MSYMVCPFCNATDFDAIGLKSHFTSGYCEVFNNVETIEEERIRINKELEEFRKKGE